MPAEPDDLRRSDLRRPWLAARREDLRWARTHLAPWVVRKLRGRSTGDLVDPKFPELTEVRPVDLGGQHEGDEHEQQVQAGRGGCAARCT